MRSTQERFELVDTDGSGTVDYQEIVAFLIRNLHSVSKPEALDMISEVNKQLRPTLPTFNTLRPPFPNRTVTSNPTAL